MLACEQTPKCGQGEKKISSMVGSLSSLGACSQDSIMQYLTWYSTYHIVIANSGS